MAPGLVSPFGFQVAWAFRAAAWAAKARRDAPTRGMQNGSPLACTGLKSSGLTSPFKKTY